MFEVGFTEIVLILGLALLVLGPEKLPGLANKIGRWTGRARSMARQLRAQLEQEVTLDELSKATPKSASSFQSDATIHAGTSAEMKSWPPDVDTSPEAMHGAGSSAPVAGDHAESDAAATTPEAMHGIAQNKAQS